MTFAAVVVAIATLLSVGFFRRLRLLETPVTLVVTLTAVAGLYVAGVLP